MDMPVTKVVVPYERQSPPPVFENEDRLKLFVGRLGLRAGWGISIYLLLTILVSTIFYVGALAATGHLNGVIAKRKAKAIAHKSLVLTDPATTFITVDDTIIGAGLGLTGVAIASWFLSFIERRRIAVYGIGRFRFNDFLLGSFSGMASLSLLIGLLSASHYLVFDSRTRSGLTVVVYGIAWLIAYLLIGLLEEYLSRGYLQYTLTRGLIGLGERISSTHARTVAFWIAAVIMSTLFAAKHLSNHGESAIGIIATFLLGIVLSYALWRTGSLWWAVGFHVSWDWAQSFFFGVPDSGALSAGRQFQTHPVGNVLLSGGSVGPEGSVLVIPTLLLVILITRITTRPGLQPALDPMSAVHAFD